jgi:hypothetical protein
VIVAASLVGAGSVASMGFLGDGVSFARELRERGVRQRASNEARIAHRLAIKEQIREDFAPLLRGDVEAEVLVRDADRQPDGWPDPDWKFRLRRLSPTFKVGVMHPYSNGITALLRLDSVFIADGIARSQVKGDPEDGELVRVVGQIPYDAIVAVDRDGDANFSAPHVYCHFDFGHEPYERIVLYREHAEGRWLPIEDVEYKPDKTPPWRQYLWHRESLKRQRQYEQERRRYMAAQRPER